MEHFSEPLTIGFGLAGADPFLMLPEVTRLTGAGIRVLPIGFAEAKTRLPHLSGATADTVDAMVLAADGNALERLFSPSAEDPALAAAQKILLRQKPLIVWFRAEEGLASSAHAIADLLSQKHVYPVPFGQPNPRVAPLCVASRSDRILPTLCHAMAGRQLQPMLEG